MRIRDSKGNERIRLIRPLRCSTCWWFCCLQKMEVQCPPGNPIGHIQQLWTLFGPSFEVCNENGLPNYRIDGPCCRWKCNGDVVFRVCSIESGVEIGRITKQVAISYFSQNFEIHLAGYRLLQLKQRDFYCRRRQILNFSNKI